MNKSQYDLAVMLCTELKGVGSRLAEHLERCGIITVQDLLFHLPYRYEDRTRITQLGKARPGDHVVIEATVTYAEVKQGRRTSLLCYLQDGTGHLTLRFFYFSDKQYFSLKPGLRLRCFGEIRGFRGEFEMIHPEYEFINTKTAPLSANSLTPIYPATEGLTQRHLRLATDQALNLLSEGILSDHLPVELLKELNMPTLQSALQYVHRPPPNADVEQLLAGVHPTQQRLSFEELVAHQLSLRRLRQMVEHHQAPLLTEQKHLTQKLLQVLPFALTNAQQRVQQEIAQDLAQTKPMLRLLQGDVGSGKTIIAALAALQAVENNFQAAFMAPTELLAEQHFRNFTNWLASLGIETVWLAGKLKNKIRVETLEKIANGQAKIIIGTHALFQADVVFANLGLVIIDEQHRFGVHQRLALREKGKESHVYPHQLIMTATPIPRTLAMTAYADLDNSVIDELPPGRIPVRTVVMPDKRRNEILQHVQKVCEEGRQAYWVCPLIDESDLLQCQAAETTAAQLTSHLTNLRVGLIHSRVPSIQKEDIMSAFKQGEINLLVATTVIEVGVDVPNASLMVIENAERLGLAQLHQLRGRVGRGAQESFCVLLYQHDRLSVQAKARLAVLRETTDGFLVARRDLELRGPGEVLGTKQAGVMQLKVADLLRDHLLLPKVQATSEILLRDFPGAVELLIKRWLASKEKYGQA